MKHLEKIKRKSRSKGNERHQVPKTSEHLSAPISKDKAPNVSEVAHEPDYYHSDNAQNRAKAGESLEGQSPHLHYERDN